MRKHLRLVSQKSANVSVNKTLINLLQQNEKAKRKKKPSDAVVYEEMPQEEQQPDPLPQYNKFPESSNDESSDKEKIDAKFV